MNIVVSYIITLAILVIIDYIYLKFVSADFYKYAFKGMLMDNIRVIPALLSWSLIALGIVLFVLPMSTGILDTILYGALFGFVSYGIYNMTNMATLQFWSWELVIRDTAWGAFVTALVSLLSRFVTQN
jgi:uncharacterized membrane protein